MYFQLKSIQRKKVLARPGLELTTIAFEDYCSTTELRNFVSNQALKEYFKYKHYENNKIWIY